LDIRNAQKKFVLYRELKSREVVNNDNHMQSSRNGNARGSSNRASSVLNDGLISHNDSGDERTIYSAADDVDNNNNLVLGDDNNDNNNDDDAAAAIAAQTYSTPKSEESMELTPAHAVGFLFSASTSLLILFYFKIYASVKIMYAFGCSGAFAQTLVHPGLTYVCQRVRYTKPMQNYTWLTEEYVAREVQQGSKMKSNCLSCLLSFFGPVSPIDVIAILLAYGVGATWLWIGFTVPHPGTVTFYWLIQDIFGLCMCMLFLETIKLNAIKVGAILLIVAFFYDIFFVFVTPLLTKHGESIMVNVATSGGPPKADPSWCEKYPHDVDCKGGDPLPMLFSVPRIGDYQGGSSMLGLGDIVLPGLLLSFASRYDESKRLMGMISGGSGRVVMNSACQASPRCFLCSWCTCCIGTGYFGPVMVAYAVGLAMANIAVYVMEMGQPALLYLVPCCLGTMVYMGKKAGELSDLWDGPRAIRFCETLLYGAASQEVENTTETRDREDEDRALESRSVNNEEAELT
jgi:signal peptide peptidase-like protein 2B